MTLLLALLPSAALALDGPTFSVERGLYGAAFSLEISPEVDGDTVLVSTGNAAPTAASTGPLTIDATTIVRAQEVGADGELSPVITHTYLFLADVVQQASLYPAITRDAVYGPILSETLADLPTISLVSSSFTTAEAATSFEWIDPDGPDLQMDAGAKRTGTTSLGYPKNHFRLYFRSSYGDGDLDLDLFGSAYTGLPPVDSFDKINLRSGGHDSVFYLGSRGQYLRNRWMDESQLEMGHIAPHGRYVHLYLNTSYTGLYHVRERFDGDFLASYMGGDSDDYEIINGGTATHGSGSVWSTITATASDYQIVKTYLDVQNFIDYMILNFYAGNSWDWSYNHNWMAGGPSEPGRARYIFHSSDNDICIYYDYTVNVLDNVGPSYVWYYLKTEWDPDFATLFADRVHALLEGDGPLSADATGARYSRLAGEIEGAVVAESARWGGGTWDRDDEWVTERDHMLGDFFPYRTAELLRQIRAAGWYPLDAPEFSLEEGVIEADEALMISVPDGVDAELWVSLDGTDPRLQGGEVADGALGPDPVQSFNIEHSARILARLKQGDLWGPVQSSFFEVDETPAVVLNEYNAVDPDETLRDDGEDSALGQVEGNGGDWFELLVLQDHLDLRGWTISLEDRLGEISTLTFTDAEVLSDLRSGTLFTIAEDLPEDTSYAPERGDWRFHLRAGAAGSGEIISATDFDVDAAEWRLTLWDPEGYARFGPAGEGVSPRDGVSSREVGALLSTPDADTRRDAPEYGDSKHSTYGYPNALDDGQIQDLSALRSVVEAEEAPHTGDTAEDSGDSAEAPDEDTSSIAEDSTPTDTKDEGGCGCAGGGEAGMTAALLALLLALSRRRVAGLALLVACADDKGGESGGDAPTESVSPDSEPDQDSADSASTACFQDADGDGYGDPDAATSCETGVSNSGDCDDGASSAHPGAWEV